ncbi:hypothetical protein CsSME_00054187 [Camellia sinensis var. sinensis]
MLLVLVKHIETDFSPFLKFASCKISSMCQTAVLRWMHDPAGRDAIILKQALSSGSTNLEAVTEVLCSRTPSQLYTLKQIYYSMFGVYLENDIEQLTSGDHKKVVPLSAVCL